MVMERGTYQGYFTKPLKSLFIAVTAVQKESEKREFVAEGLDLNFVGGSRYLGDYIGTREELDTWAHRVKVLGKIAKRHPQ